MSNKILHNKIPIDEYGSMLIPVRSVSEIHNYIMEIVKQLDDNYIVITSPTEISCLNDNDVVISIDAKDYTYNELKEIIQKANNYNIGV